MTFKRKAHVLFIGSGDLCRAMMAAAYANTHAAEWLEARAVARHLGPLNPELITVMQEVNIAIEDQTVHPFDRANIEWSDVVVTLDAESDAACPALPAHVQKRCYPFARPTDLASLRAVRDAIRARIDGMVGGMRMIA